MYATGFSSVGTILRPESKYLRMIILGLITLFTWAELSFQIASIALDRLDLLPSLLLILQRWMKQQFYQLIAWTTK